jgi:hypothetical protein
MERRFPLKSKSPPLKAEECEAVWLAAKPIKIHSKRKTVVLPEASRNGFITQPVILNFPDRVL